MDREILNLEKALEQIWDIAINFGLDPFPIHFEIVPATVMYEIGSYALPGRYSHWTFGKAYHRMKTMYDFGLSRIYEVVINTNPSYGFLLETNSPTQNKLVMAHVLGHVDFFKNNAYFSRTNRRMVDEVSHHSARINEYEFKYGRKTVEEFLDAVLSIEEHVDPDFFIKKDRDISPEKREKIVVTGKFDDLMSAEERKKMEVPKKIHVPGAPVLPEKDLVWFIAHYSPILELWQRDVMDMIHQEMLYFVPQMQTKTINEGWACATGDSLLLTEQGFIRFEQLYQAGRKIRVAGGGKEETYPITDFHKEESVPTIRITTRRGLTIEGSLNHRLLLADGRWTFLKDVNIGDRLPIESGTNIWPQEKQSISFVGAQPSVVVKAMAAFAGGSSQTAYFSLIGQEKASNVGAVVPAVKATSYLPGSDKKVLSTRAVLKTTGVLDEDVAWFLGYFIGDGHRTKSGICFTTGDIELAERLKDKITTSFGLRSTVYWQPIDNEGQGGRWRVVVHSRNLLDWLQSLGINLEDKARTKKIPPPILRSPKEVMSAFLRGYFDADAYAGEGIRLSSASEDLIRTVQIVLLNYGIFSTQQPCQDSCTQLHVFGASAKRFLNEIGFSLPRKQRALREYVENHRWFRKEDLTDPIVSIEYGCADVFDITVDAKHAYVANGLVNHNSFWHSRIMRELGLEGDDYLEFAELHAGVVSPHKGQMNPYFVGYKILEDIEKRWDHPTQEEREKYGRKGGEGRQKLFEVREMENDVSLLRNYLTEDLCEELDLYVYELVDEEEWTITEKKWERVRDQLVASKTNFGFPSIEVTEADFNGNRELYLTHRFDGAELDLKYARKVLEYVHRLWGRTVHLETKVDDDTLVLHYDGKEHDED